MNIKTRALLVCLFCSGLTGEAGAQFLLGPHRSVFCGTPVGKKVSSEGLGEAFKIINKSPQKRVYTVEIKKPKDAGRKLMFGYSGIPDVSFVLPPKSIEVQGNSEKAIPLVFNIPEREAFYNRKWEAELLVREAGTNISIELEGQLWVETQAKAQERPASYGPEDKEEFFISPASVELDGFAGSMAVRLHNLSARPLTLLIVSESPPQEIVEMFIPLSLGYERLADEEWLEPVIAGEEKVRRIKRGKEIAPQKKITLAPGKSVEMRLNLKIPVEKEHRGRKWESYVFVRCPELNKDRFVRVRGLTGK